MGNVASLGERCPDEQAFVGDVIAIVDSSLDVGVENASYLVVAHAPLHAILGVCARADIDERDSSSLLEDDGVDAPLVIERCGQRLEEAERWRRGSANSSEEAQTEGQRGCVAYIEDDIDPARRD